MPLSHAVLRLASVLFLLTVFAFTFLPRHGQAGELALLRYTGSQRCIGCHQAQGATWQQSHHARSMQVADGTTVLGNFRDAELNHHGQRTQFFRRGGKFFVRIEEAGNPAREFPIAYTFGVHPLQQYLIALPGGRLQALAVAWDARSREEGGQRWYHLYPESPPQPGESAHWRGRDQNWNFMCASCHSTGVRKNYDAVKNSYRTSWSALNVSCEACHGPGSAHVDWASSKKGKKDGAPPRLGLVAETVRQLSFSFTTQDQAIASTLGNPAQGRTATEACLGCHSRRQELLTDKQKDGREIEQPYLDRYLPALIEKGLYHADGQVDGEVFEGGSFAQSAMHRAGVSCTNCHEAHSLKLRASGNTLCAQCHLPARYDRPEHHRHPLGSTGAQCINCHMPAKTFMGVHVRRDHSLRIPRPDLSQQLGTPDACSQCHVGRPSSWAADALAQWRKERGQPALTSDHFSSAIDAAWLGSPAADRLQLALAKETSGMVSASLLSLLPADGSPQGTEAVAKAARDKDGWVRLGAARALAGQSSPPVLAIGGALLGDSLRAVRIEAARSLAGTPKTRLTEAQQQSLQAAIDELIAVESASAERPEAHVNLANLYRRLGKPEMAEGALKNALKLEPSFVPALVNLADLYRQLHRDAEAEPLLRQAVRKAPEAAEAAHALGLLLIRQGRKEEALVWLQKSVVLAPGNSRYVYVLDLARKEVGK
ncbi:MAG TPA: tetratricopeptide repeat protein [Rhodocyclaceae bacterium]